MRRIKVIDARMGRGKSSAAIQFMNARKGGQCFLYITPYLSEVERVCNSCGFDEPDCDFASKSNQLKRLMKQKANIASTHTLFLIMDAEALELARENGYSIIIDESLPVITSVKLSSGDKELLFSHLLSCGEDGKVEWSGDEYTGRFDDIKEILNTDNLYFCSNNLYKLMAPERFLFFDEVIVMTYLFGGQVLKAYFDYYNFTYTIVGVIRDEYGFHFSDKPDSPPPTDYSKLIHIFGTGESSKDERVNNIGDSRTALSKSWFQVRKSKTNHDMKVLLKNLNAFFARFTRSEAKLRLWTTFKDYQGLLHGDNSRYKASFLALNARATNAYRSTNCVAYLVNRFIDPNVKNFFASKDISVDQDLFALSEMLQFVWRSAIRDGKEINLYIPSKRMRELLVKWMEMVASDNEFEWIDDE